MSVFSNLMSQSGGGGSSAVLGDGSAFTGQYFHKTFATYTGTIDSNLCFPVMFTTLIQNPSQTLPSDFGSSVYLEIAILTKTAWDASGTGQNTYAQTLEYYNSPFLQDVKNGTCAAVMFMVGGNCIGAYQVDLATQVIVTCSGRVYMSGDLYWMIDIEYTSNGVVVTDESQRQVYNYSKTTNSSGVILSTTMNDTWALFGYSNSELGYSYEYNSTGHSIIWSES
jgi:hypothetical protein